jgi:hypothetical protein
VWIGLDAPDWPRRSDFVVFWTNVLDWLGQGGEVYAAAGIEPLEEGWRKIAGPPGGVAGLWPGMYRQADGRLRAVNAPAPRIAPIPAGWEAKLAKLQPSREGTLSLAAPLLLAALGLMLGASLTWTQRRP